MKKNILMILGSLCILYGHGQQTSRAAKPAQFRTSTQLSETEIYQRIRRVGYERRLDIDSATAMRLVFADEAEQKSIQSALEDRSLSVEGRAAAIRGYRSVREHAVRSALSSQQLSRLIPSGGRGNSQRALTVKKDPTGERMSVVLERYGAELSATEKDSRLDAEQRKKRTAELSQARDRELEHVHLEDISNLQARQSKIFERTPLPADSTQRRVKELLDRSKRTVPPTAQSKR